MHGFPNQFPIERGNATEPIVWGNLGNWYWYFSQSMGPYFPLNFHFMVYFIIWEMHVFSHQFLITCEKTAKPIEWGKAEKLVSSNILQNPLYLENLRNCYTYFSHSMDAFFHYIPILSYTSSYRKCMVFWSIFHSMRKVRKTHQMGKAWEIGSWENPKKPIVCGEPGKLVVILFP